jgi:hypothetical protein
MQAGFILNMKPQIWITLCINVACVAAAYAQTRDNSIGLGLDKLHLSMSMADARAAYPALSGDPQMGLLSGAYEFDRCAFALVLEFGGNDSLFQVELDTAANVESCKTDIMRRLMAQYGPSQKGCPIWAASIYMQVDGPLEIFVTDNRPQTPSEIVRQPSCQGGTFAAVGTAGASDGQHHLGIVFHAAGSGIAIFQ